MEIAKKIGIWGYGVVGKSLINYLSNKNLQLSILEKKNLSQDEIVFLNKNKIKFFNQNAEIEKFFNENDLIIPSPGIDLRPYKKLQNKFITELDLFGQNFKKPIIAITGTIAKTTITHLIANILKLKNKNAIAAGNIGIGMCDLIENQNSIDAVVLEISSFQLEFCKSFAPDFAIWTNFLPNHLDRHDSLESYFDAKFKIISNQNSNQKSLINFSLLDEIYQRISSEKKLNFFNLEKPCDDEIKKIRNNDSLFFVENNQIIKFSKNIFEKILDLKNLPNITFKENWLIICSALYLMEIDLNFENNLNLSLPEHRLEKFVSINDIEFYNDSKSTIPDSTIAAVSKFQSKEIILFLGGLSKGVDRSNLIKKLKNKVKFIICFGAEAEQLNEFCKNCDIKSLSCKTLNEAVEICFEFLKPGDIVIFSPAGSSFDLFANYIERGKTFKSLVEKKIR